MKIESKHGDNEYNSAHEQNIRMETVRQISSDVGFSPDIKAALDTMTDSINATYSQLEGSIASTQREIEKCEQLLQEQLSVLKKNMDELNDLSNQKEQLDDDSEDNTNGG